MEAARCGKNAIRPRTQSLRQERENPDLFYVRDRDFDFEPLAEQGAPVPEHDHAGGVIGWHWCRHEIENYLVDPAIVSAATGWPFGEYAQALVQAAGVIRHYETARWAIGRARRSLPPYYELRTKPDVVDDAKLEVPVNLSEEASNKWARGAAREFAERANRVLADAEIQLALAEYHERLQDALAEIGRVLIWYPGKDLLASLAGWLATRGLENPGAFRARIRDWIRANPEDALARLPEWERFRERLNR